jgi:NAD(P)-dependent dehydrogenase (short-subunit alcohol dehydrogenase family)
MFLTSLGNSGIGYEITLQLASHHARVYIAARSRKRGEEAIAKLKASSKLNLDLHFLEMDLQSLQSVKLAAAEFMKFESRLDLLINNAGVRAIFYVGKADWTDMHDNSDYGCTVQAH